MVSLVVIDGVTIGHPCCAVHNCRIPLTSQRHHFCPTHADRNNICAINMCGRPIEQGSRVCDNILHQAIQRRYIETGQAQFQLIRRLLRTRRAAGNNSDPNIANAQDLSDLLDEEREQVFQVDPEGRIFLVDREDGQTVPVDDDVPTGGHRRIRAQFSRRRTHNEQVIVAPCGVIIARATFFGAEALNAVAVCLFFSAFIFV